MTKRTDLSRSVHKVKSLREQIQREIEELKRQREEEERRKKKETG
jgi:hypothetical protein